MYIKVPIIKIINSMINIFSYPVIPITAAIMASVFFVKKEIRDDYKYILNLSLLVMFITTVLMSSLSGRTFPHYYMVFLPCLIIPLTWMSEIIINHIKLKPVIILLLIIFIFNQSLFKGTYMLVNSIRTDATAYKLALLIKENTKKDEPILYIGNYCITYLLSERPPAGYYPYYPRGVMDDPSKAMNYSSSIESYIDELASKKPRLIAYGRSTFSKTLENYISDNYSVIYEYKMHKICRLKDSQQ